MTPSVQKLNPMALVTAAALGGILGVFMQLWMSRQGWPTFQLPYSHAATMAVIAVVLVALGWRLRNALTGEKKRPINPFSAVRLLAAARAGQLLGAASFGLAAGLIVVLLFRLTAPQPSLWVSTAVTGAVAIGLLIAGIVTENLCKVPPSEGSDGSEDDDGDGDGAVVTGQPVTS